MLKPPQSHGLLNSFNTYLFLSFETEMSIPSLLHQCNLEAYNLFDFHRFTAEEEFFPGLILPQASLTHHWLMIFKWDFGLYCWCWNKSRLLGSLRVKWIHFVCIVESDSLWPHGLQHARLPCPSLWTEPHEQYKKTFCMWGHKFRGPGGKFYKLWVCIPPPKLMLKPNPQYADA